MGTTVEAAQRRPLARTRFPTPMLAAVDRLARRDGLSRAESIRALVTAGLEAHGAWPPRCTDEQ